MEDAATTLANGELDSEDPRSLIEQAAKGAVKATDEKKLEDATEWLLGAFAEPPTVEKALVVNVGGPKQRHEVEWVVKSLPGPKIRQIREEAEIAVQRLRERDTEARGTNNVSFEANVRLVVAGTIKPDLAALAKQLGTPNPAHIVEVALQNKQGLVDQIAGEIVTISGYDTADVRDKVEVEAAGNS